MVLHGWASSAAVVAVSIVMPLMAFTAVVMRIYARFGVTKNAGWDDGFIVVSMLFSIATTVTIIAQVETGLGKHMWQIDKHDAFLNLRNFFVMIIVYNISLTFTKLSILIQYTRLFPQKSFQLAVRIVMGAVIVYALWRFFSAIFTCSPVAAFWDHSIKPFTCQNKYAIAMASTSLNMITDLAIALLPLPVLNQLHLPTRQKYALITVFALAGLVVMISILRLPSLVTLWKTKDTSYVNPMVMIWSDIEINVGIVCSCLPTLRCLVPGLLRSVGSGYSRERSGGGTGEGSQGSHVFGVGAKEAGLHASSNRKSHGYAFVGGAGGGQGSFGGKFSSKVSVTAVGQERKNSVRKKKQLLQSVEEVEMGSMKEMLESSATAEGVPGGHVHEDGKIMVQTEIQQIETKGFDQAQMGGGKELASYEREMV